MLTLRPYLLLPCVVLHSPRPRLMQHALQVQISQDTLNLFFLPLKLCQSTPWVEPKGLLT